MGITRKLISILSAEYLCFDAPDISWLSIELISEISEIIGSSTKVKNKCRLHLVITWLITESGY